MTPNRQLDRTEAYRSQPRQLVLSTLRLFSEQCARGFRDGKAVKFPSRYRAAKNIFMCGMGGSALGSDVIRHVFMGTLRIPYTIVNGYHLPAFVDRNTLVVFSSYSGTTEEVLSATTEAKKRGAMVTGLTRGGRLGAFFKRNNYPWYRIDGEANPAGQPRMGLGYSVMGQLGLLSSVGLLKVAHADATAIVRYVRHRAKAFETTVPTSRNEAKSLAASLLGRIPVLIGTEHCSGSIHAFANQLNETPKTFAIPFIVPELNHHLLEGLRFPKAVKNGTFIFVSSSHYDDRITKRQHITAEIVKKRGLKVVQYRVRGADRLTQAFDLLVLAGYTSFYLSVLHNCDPLEIQTVNEFKERLVK
jgi:glucose/mannose-6-phosphate isomerase